MEHRDYLVAIDKVRNRVFVLAKPFLVAVKKDNQWYYGATINDEEIKKYYELEFDKNICKSWIEEARSKLHLPY